MTCPVCCTPAAVIDASVHDEWHQRIAPLTRADAMTLESAYGRPSIPTRTYVDDQFDAARGISKRGAA